MRERERVIKKQRTEEMDGREEIEGNGQKETEEREKERDHYGEREGRGGEESRRSRERRSASVCLLLLHPSPLCLLSPPTSTFILPPPCSSPPSPPPHFVITSHSALISLPIILPAARRAVSSGDTRPPDALRIISGDTFRMRPGESGASLFTGFKWN